jgi:hypothetical protein
MRKFSVMLIIFLLCFIVNPVSGLSEQGVTLELSDILPIPRLQSL